MEVTKEPAEQMKKVIVLGTRGVPANHGGFETAVEKLARFLHSDDSWEITVFCQERGRFSVVDSSWKGIHRKVITVPLGGTLSTIVFDVISLVLALRMSGVLLTMGYPTAFLWILPRILGRYHVVNMDGIEWKRAQFGWFGRLWYWINEKLGCVFANRLIADHPEIARHLSKNLGAAKKIITIPYGGDFVDSANQSYLDRWSLVPNEYFLVIARPEVDNSILEIVEAYCRKPRKPKLLIVGRYDPSLNEYHHRVISAANDEVIFSGPIYERSITDALRFFSLGYIHGHRVGGTNPSLVESLGASSAIIANDNRFNRWVAGESAYYFANKDELASILTMFEFDRSTVNCLREKARYRRTRFQWADVNKAYQVILAEGVR